MSKTTGVDTVFNPSTTTTLEELINQKLSRRTILKGSGGLAALVASGCGGGGSSSSDGPIGGVVPTATATPAPMPTPSPTPTMIPTPSATPAPVTPTPSMPPVASDRATVSLGFESVTRTKANAVTVPEGYEVSLLGPWGTALRDKPGGGSYDFVTNERTTAEAQANSIGMHHDGMRFYPTNADSTEGLMCVNHEYLLQWVMIAAPNYGPTFDDSGNRLNIDEIRAEINSLGVSVYKVRKVNNDWEIVKNDPMNRRITGATPVEFSGPADGSDFLKTKYSQDGKSGRGTFANCGNGFTPWGTYLTCEENWPNFFKKDSSSYPLTDIQSRLGITPSGTNTSYRWDKGQNLEGQDQDDIARFNINNDGASALEDYRNEDNTYGYIVEIDPNDPDSTPVKHTALGRYRHECCVSGKVEEGQPLSFYSGHDSNNEYIYKFVTQANWDPADANRTDKMAVGRKYLGAGTLYVARFSANGVGVWVPLTLQTPGLEGFTSDAEIAVKTVIAADRVNATPMDRPEWFSVDPFTHTVYVALTNNKTRSGTNAANPRTDNIHGHIVRWNEGSSVTEFEWDVFAFGSDAAGARNNSDLSVANEFSSPDGLNFDQRGILWVQTDVSEEKFDNSTKTYIESSDPVMQMTNNQMLAVIPSKMRDAADDLASIDSSNESQVKRFLVGPYGCEITGLTFTPDHTTMFVNVQHPSRWPLTDPTAEAPLGDQGPWPRSTTLAIRRTDGGPVGE